MKLINLEEVLATLIKQDKFSHLDKWGRIRESGLLCQAWKEGNLHMFRSVRIENNKIVKLLCNIIIVDGDIKNRLFVNTDEGLNMDDVIDFINETDQAYLTKLDKLL